MSLPADFQFSVVGQKPGLQELERLFPLVSERINLKSEVIMLEHLTTLEFLWVSYYFLCVIGIGFLYFTVRPQIFPDYQFKKKFTAIQLVHFCRKK